MPGVRVLIGVLDMLVQVRFITVRYQPVANHIVQLFVGHQALRALIELLNPSDLLSFQALHRVFKLIRIVSYLHHVVFFAQAHDLRFRFVEVNVFTLRRIPDAHVTHGSLIALARHTDDGKAIIANARVYAQDHWLGG